MKSVGIKKKHSLNTTLKEFRVNKSNRNKALVSISIIALIVAVIAGIYFVKTGSEKTPSEDLAHPLEITTVDLDEIKGSNVPIIIDFGATECIPCKEMAPVLVKLNDEMQGKARIHFVDVWKDPTAARGFPIQLIPTQLLINADGTPYTPSEDMKIEFTAYSDKETGEHIYTTHEGGLSEDQLRSILKDMRA